MIIFLRAPYPDFTTSKCKFHILIFPTTRQVVARDFQPKHGWVEVFCTRRMYRGPEGDLGERYMASYKSQITNNKSGTLERTGRAILRNPLELSDSLLLQII